MRLTLRNLLAYLHGTLLPEQHDAFAQLVQSTPRVQLLVDRCRNLAARRMAAPDLDQTLPQFQAETVAKYLDFTLPDDQLAAFEKAALASDELLAEIVNSHHVLADVVKQRIVSETASTPFRQRLLTLPSAPGHAQESPAYAAEIAATVKKNVSDFAPVAAGIKADLHDSGDLSEYLSDVDDEEELSLDIVKNRAKAVEQRAMAVAAQAYTSGGGGMTATAAARAAVLEQQEAYNYESPIPDGTKKKPIPVPVMAGIGGGVVLLLGLVVWMGSALFAGKKAEPSGPHFYGVAATPGKTLCELRGTITYQPASGGPSPDVGAIIVAWPTQPSAEANRLTTTVLMEDLEAKRQNPYNEMLVVAKCDDDGRFQMRMHEHGEFHVMILSQKASTSNPVTWGEAVEAIAAQLEDPVALIGNRKYEYRKLTMPAEHQATLDFAFAE